jgi:hypothetical protein
MEPRPAETWQHFKGSRYAVVGVSRDSEAWDDETKLVVVYFRSDKPPNQHPILIHRPLSMWTEKVVSNEYGYNGPRFFKVKDSPDVKP